MAVNESLLRRPNDRALFLLAAVGFPLIVLAGYFRSYYFSAFFPDVPAVANMLVHLHGITMTAWVLFFVAQVTLIRTRNVKLHRKMGIAGVILAAIVVVVGMATAYDAQLIRGASPPGTNPYGFFSLPAGDMFLFVVFFGAAIYFRKRPAEHKSLMLMTAINFLPAAFFRFTFIPGWAIMFFSFGLADLIAVSCLIWHSVKHGRVNRVFAAAVLLMFLSHPLRFYLVGSETWIRLVGLIAP